jgi:hypothetical protein
MGHSRITKGLWLMKRVTRQAFFDIHEAYVLEEHSTEWN